MDCHFIKENLFAITEGTISPGTEAQVMEHLDACPGCKELYSVFRVFEGSIQKDRSAEPDPFMATRTLALLESKFPENSGGVFARNRFILRPILIGLFLGIAILAGILSGRFGFMRNSQAVGSGENELLKSELAIDALADEESSSIIQ
jgi:predicted anti-sigma-YlaC factor YlaD